jgi:hypothetical protein
MSRKTAKGVGRGMLECPTYRFPIPRNTLFAHFINAHLNKAATSLAD